MAITVVWAAGITADAFLPGFQLSGWVYATMLGLASAIFGSNFVKGIRG